MRSTSDRFYLRMLLCFLGLALSYEVAMSSQAAFLSITIEHQRFEYPRPIVIPVQVFAPEPVENANVWGELISPSGKKAALNFIQVTHDPISVGLAYQTVIDSVSEDGDYKLTVWADDNQSRAFFAQGLTDDPRPGDKSREQNLRQTVPNFGPISASILLTLNGYSKGGPQKPVKIYDFNLKSARSGCVDYFFRAPLNTSAGDLFEIRQSPVVIDSETIWSQSRVVKSGIYEKGGDLVLGEICGLKPGFYFLAVRSRTRQGVEGEISNNYSIKIP